MRLQLLHTHSHSLVRAETIPQRSVKRSCHYVLKVDLLLECLFGQVLPSMSETLECTFRLPIGEQFLHETKIQISYRVFSSFITHYLDLPNNANPQSPVASSHPHQYPPIELKEHRAYEIST